jgi:hypothetical protein
MPYWAVARTAPNRDRLAAESVCQARFETFTPKIRTRVGRETRARFMALPARIGAQLPHLSRLDIARPNTYPDVMEPN